MTPSHRLRLLALVPLAWALSAHMRARVAERVPSMGEVAAESHGGSVEDDSGAGSRTTSPTTRRESGGDVRTLDAIRRGLGLGSVAGSREETRRRLRDDAEGTYIADVVANHDSALARWPERVRRPLRVWVDGEPSLWDYDSAYAGEVRRAFREWEATGIPVRFDFVDDSAQADIHVAWVDRFREPISGKTIWSRNDGWWIVDARILLAVRHSSGDPLDAAAVHAIALHEVGHLLGLDHTRDEATIMTPRVRVRTLSDADRRTVRLLYTLPAGSVRAR
jgi:hypothetical protein